MSCKHEKKTTTGEPGNRVVTCTSCGAELDRTNREVWDLVDARGSDSAAIAAENLVDVIDAGKDGHGRRRKAV